MIIETFSQSLPYLRAFALSRRRRVLRLLTALGACIALCSCAVESSTDDPGADSGVGGDFYGTGGVVGTGASVATGGYVSTGGVYATGGLVGTGAAVGTGGLVATGGFATGGEFATGGVVNTGGSVATGGVVNTGGTLATGGVVNTGGTVATGGASTGGAGTGGTSTGGAGTGGAASLPKFVGNITTGYGNALDTNGKTFSKHWDQVTPENAGKWGSVQSSTNSQFNWSALDGIYDYAQDHGIIFKQHTFVWGSQQPSGTPTEAQVKTWIQKFCERYPNTKLIDVVNEPPPHTTPNYANNIGGGTNGNWAWITNAFKWADQYCPNAILILNDYNNIEWPNDNQHFIDIVKIIKQNGAPIDAVGAQSHDLDHASVSFNTAKNLLAKLHNDTGLPVHITEFDISFTDDQKQLTLYQQYIPHFMDTDWVKGVTVWGWIVGQTWSQAPDSGLVRANGTARPAMTWLMTELGRPQP